MAMIRYTFALTLLLTSVLAASAAVAIPLLATSQADRQELSMTVYNNNLGLVQRARNRYDLALAAFERAMAVDPGYAYAPLQIGITHFLRGDRGEALRYLRLVRQRFPQLERQVAPYLQVLER